MKKRPHKFKNAILTAITAAAIVVVFASMFAYDLWPHKSIVAMFVAMAWLAAFVFANNFTNENSVLYR